MGFWEASLRPRKQSNGFYSRLETSSIQMQIKGKKMGPHRLSAVVHFASTNYSFFSFLFLPNNDKQYSKRLIFYILLLINQQT